MSATFDVKKSGGNVFVDIDLAALEEEPEKAELFLKGGLVPASG